MTKSVQAHAVVVAGAASTTAGAYGMAGWQIAALVGGTQAIVYGLLVVDVDDSKDRQQPDDPRRTRHQTIERGKQ